MRVYMEVTKDKYELPVAIADTPTQLAKICHTSASNIYSSAYKRERGIKKGRFLRVNIEED